MKDKVDNIGVINTIESKTGLLRANYFIRHIYWHFHEYGLNVSCFGCILHIVGSS